MQTHNFPSNPTIPVVDLTDSFDRIDARFELARQIDQICQTIGFFIVTGHGVSEILQEQMMKVSKVFFDMPLAIKGEIRGSEDYPYGYNGIEDENLSRGYSKSSVSSLPDIKESFSIGPSHEGVIRWPSEPKSMSEIWLNYYRACEQLARHLYKLFSLALNLNENWFENKIDHHRCALRALFYPEFFGSFNENQFRSSPHTDYGAFTILKQDSVGGLQVENRHNHQWIGVPYVPNSFVINLGDLMSRWTNDRWVSTVHRVVISSPEPRQSVAFFCQINPDEIVTCISTCASDDQPAKYPPIKSWDLIMQKYLASTGKKNL